MIGKHVALALVLAGWGAGVSAQTPQTAPPAPAKVDMQTLDYRLEPRRIAENTWVIEGAVEDFSRSNGCNIINTAFIATDQGVVVINTGPSRLYGEQQRKAIEKLTQQPVLRVFNLNLHPDYFLGNAAWSDKPTQALAGSIAGMKAEGAAYEDNLYRLCGDWMRGTQAEPAREAIVPQTIRLGSHVLELRRLRGHTGDDLVIIDQTTGVLFAGGLVFADRVPTTPHADPQAWLASLQMLRQWQDDGLFKWVVPSHGPVHEGPRGMEQTSDWLQWLVSLMQRSADKGVDLSELLRTRIPERFAGWGAQPAEFHRSLAQWYPRYEEQALSKSK
ncbi:quinoprotein relay system zinc metallohydrolase 1 [Diaphorobacter caeni]|uniref:quinoprotein relay system zinc metallohydrolase 1 n=1 Tax=Diaphorobacter caeni TaxID=2784387 RepID=UPI00188EC761|nr:quinoprotein relay system zinc metallohydrolase 1 [Diaphorobacter caeni]MBF5005169.1 quinoprotein relay system zinc metallohydrolase 1 [Diaphorobacter caeni]